MTAEGRPFFWLGYTAWELFHRLDRAEAELYRRDRAAKGFNVIQAVVLAELNGLTGPNGYGHLPLGDLDPARPAVKDGPANDYWDFVDEVLDLAAANGLYTGFLPTWGKCVTSSAFAGKSKDAVYGDCLEELDASIGTPSATKKHREHSLL